MNNESGERGLHDYCSMQYWWPRLESIDVPTPTTIEIGSEERPIMDGSMSMKVPDKHDVRDAVVELDGPPAFLRSDQMASKHDMETGSIVDTTNIEEMMFGGLIEAHLGFGAPNPDTWYVREWIDLWHKFKSFADSATPIAAEVRTFIYEGEFHDAAFYWPADAIWEHSVTDSDWSKLLELTHERTMKDRETWRAYAERVASLFDEEYWSVDFALADDGTWYCIDMARGELSWHPDGVERLVETPTRGEVEP